MGAALSISVAKTKSLPPPLTESMDPELLQRIIDTFFRETSIYNG